MSRFSPKLGAGLVALVLLALVALVSGWNAVYWEQKAAKFQYDIQRSVPLNEVKWAYSHAAHDYNRGYFWVPSTGLDADFYKRPLDSEIHHRQSITDQLNNGYRWLGFNMHHTPQISTNADDALYNCVTSPMVYQRCYNPAVGTAMERARCRLNGLIDLGNDTGCYPLYDRNFATNLGEVVNYLNSPSNNDDVVIIELHWKLTAEDNEPNAVSLLTTVINRVAGSLVYTPALKGLGPWPSIDTLVSQGKRLLFVSEAPVFSGSTLIFNPHLSSLPNFTFADQTANGFIQDICNSTKYGPTPLPHNDFIRFWEDGVYRILIDGLIPTPPASGLWSGEISLNGTRFAHYCGFTIGLTDASIWSSNNLIWSWDANQPTGAITVPRTTNCASIQRNYFRWQSEDCSIVQPYACQHMTTLNRWSIVQPGSAGNGAMTCPTNYTYTYPKNGWEMNGLFAAVAGLNINVWFNAPATPAAPTIYPTYYGLYDFNNTDAAITGNDTSPYFTYPGVPPYQPLNISSVTGPDGPRFCGLKKDALNFDCRWGDVYVQQIADREVGFLVFAGIGLGISCIFGVIIALCCCECIFKKGGRLNKMARMDDGDLDNGKGRRRDRFRFFLAIPFILVIAGAVPLFIGNIRLTSTWNDAQAFIRDQRDGLLLLKRDIVQTLLNFPNINNVTSYDPNALVRRLEAGVAEMTGNFNDFLKILDSSSLIRTVVTWFITVGMLVLCLFGFIFLIKKAPKALLFLLVLINFCVFLTILDFAVHSSMDVASKDICAEITRPNGMFQIWQRRSLIELEKMRSAANEAFRYMAIQGCNGIRALCTLPYQVCGNYPCHRGNVFTSLGNLSIIDSDGSTKTLGACNTTCTDNNLRQAATVWQSSSSVVQQFQTLDEEILEFIDNLGGAKGQRQLKGMFCGLLADNMAYVYGGAAVLLVGELTEMALLFWLAY